jgi:hypothetical protein
MRGVLALLAALSAVALASCGGSDDETAAPLPVAQRFVTAEDAPDSKPDPVETRQTTEDFDEFMASLSELAIDLDTAEATTVFEDAGFKGAGVDTRYFGEHSRTARHVFSSFIELDSDDGASSALDWLTTDQEKPCPMSCAFQISTFDVDGIPDARGVRRTATAEDIERVGTPNEVPTDDYWVGFTVGPVAYTVVLHGPPGSVSEEEVEEIASAYYDRLTGD